MLAEISQIEKEAITTLNAIKNPAQLNNWKTSFLGKKGKFTLLTKKLAQLPVRKRKDAGLALNQTKQKILWAAQQLEGQWDKSEKVWLDVTAPGKKPKVGHLHPVTLAICEIVPIFERLGFSRVRYLEVETDFYAFESLNMPKNHPARDEWETFYITQDIVLTPHTSSGQVREMEKRELPIRMLNIAKCYRRQSDISHTPMFHQFEGLYIDKNVSIAHLKGVLDYFVKSFFDPKRAARIRPFHFRFTEPSFEVDITCGICNGAGCRLCKEGWLELGGAGMVHPKVLEAGHIDPKKWNGFAFGWGVERVYMMKEGLKIDDIRTLYENDIRFLEQF